MNWSYELVQSKLSTHDMKQVHDSPNTSIYSHFELS